MSCLRFGATIVISTVTMFVMMYLNTNSMDHIEFNQTRVWMALVIGAGFNL